MERGCQNGPFGGARATGKGKTSSVDLRAMALSTAIERMQSNASTVVLEKYRSKEGDNEMDSPGLDLLEDEDGDLTPI